MTGFADTSKETVDDQICGHIEKTKRLFFNGRKDTPWVCLNCGEKL